MRIVRLICQLRMLRASRSPRLPSGGLASFCSGLAVGLFLLTVYANLPQLGTPRAPRRSVLSAADGQATFRVGACTGRIRAGPALNLSSWVAPQRVEPLPRFEPKGCCRCGCLATFQGHCVLGSRSLLAALLWAGGRWQWQTCTTKGSTVHSRVLLHAPAFHFISSNSKIFNTAAAAPRDRYALLDALRQQGFTGWAAELGVASGGYSQQILERTQLSQVFSVDM